MSRSLWQFRAMASILMAFSVHNHGLCCVLCHVTQGYTLNRRQMYTARLACSMFSRSAVFSLLSFLSSILWLHSDKEGVEPELAPDHGTDQQIRRSTAELEQHSTRRSDLFVRKASKNLLKHDKQVEIVKVELTRTQTDPHAVTVFLFVAWSHRKCYL